MGMLWTQAGFVAKLGMLMGLLPLATSVVYAFWPSEQRLALMRPLSLATIFSSISTSLLGVLNALRYMGVTPAADTRIMVIGLAEALVTSFLGFGCLAAAWLAVAIGQWRRR